MLGGGVGIRRACRYRGGIGVGRGCRCWEEVYVLGRV